MTNGKKHFIGNGKTNEFFKTAVNVSIDLEKAEKFITTAKNGKKYLNFEVTPRQTPGKYGETHAISVFVKDEPVAAPDQTPDENSQTPAQKADEVKAANQMERMTETLMKNTRAQLVVIAESKNVATNGTKADIVARLV